LNTVEPIRDRGKIETMKKYLWAESPRNYLLFVLGINSGLRVSDILKLRVSDAVDQKGRVKESITIREQKTGKEKTIVINKAARRALEEFLQSRKSIDPRDYFFASRKGENQPVSRVQAWQLLNRAARAIGITGNIGTHTLRKTFGYHAYQRGTDIILLQKIFNHAAPNVTLRYIGITQDDIDRVYINLNL